MSRLFHFVASVFLSVILASAARVVDAFGMDKNSSCECSGHTIVCHHEYTSALRIGDVLAALPSCGHVYTIDISYFELTTLDFPRDFLLRYKEAQLRLFFNELTSLDGLDGWRGRSLDVSFNQLKQVDLSPFKDHLQKIGISKNRLSSLDLSSMSKLTEVIAGFNNISVLKLPAANCSLKMIYLDENELSSLPWELGNCGDLRTLMVSKNKLMIIDASKLIRLQHLSAAENGLEALKIPPKNCSLQIVDVNDNNLSSFPTSLDQCLTLTSLSVKNNSLSTFPYSLLQMMSLRFVNTSERPLQYNEVHHYALHWPEIKVLTEANPLSVYEVVSSFRKYVTAQGFTFYFFTSDNFFNNTPTGCECSTFTMSQFAPVTYCVSSMCEKDENLWKYV